MSILNNNLKKNFIITVGYYFCILDCQFCMFLSYSFAPEKCSIEEFTHLLMSNIINAINAKSINAKSINAKSQFYFEKSFKNYKMLCITQWNKDE